MFGGFRGKGVGVLGEKCSVILGGKCLGILGGKCGDFREKCSDFKGEMW